MITSSVSLNNIAARITGEIIGNPDILIHGASSLTDATTGQITFLSDRKHLSEATNTQASAILVAQAEPLIPCAQIVAPHPALAFARLVKAFFTEAYVPRGISTEIHRGDHVEIGNDGTIWPFVSIEDHVRIGDRVTLFPGVVIGKGSEIGDDCVLHPNVTVRERSRIGHRVIIHSGTVVGSDGFGYIPDNGIHEKVPQIGYVVIEDDVEIGANVAIDRATFGETVIGRGTKIDNLVQIAHNVKIGGHSLIVAQAGIAGSSTLGHHTTVAGQAGISDHVNIGDGVIVTAQTGVPKNVSSQQVVSGTPAMPHKVWLRASQTLQRLPEMHQRLRDLEKRLRVLEERRPP
ncbi:MAG: UDP-3-O-(3-hydroxymyristoyl)glucosamine N-acyltransferase [Nitrospiraceae bacterium]|nr:UDP-3-O-(3-hydroxymyristoyl)glucosamine N-acyltransferase [Nitrospiraceae bacterium]|tara:strand:- start:83 stop:1123 length:1041 start_codon:yes stop_codon:yes gene_type:complete